MSVRTEYIQTIAYVDQIQAGLKDDLLDADAEARRFVEEVMSLPTGKYMLLEGYKLVVLAMAKIEDNPTDSQTP